MPDGERERLRKTFDQAAEAADWVRPRELPDDRAEIEATGLFSG